jgi:hypothetical protein
MELVVYQSTCDPSYLICLWNLYSMTYVGVKARPTISFDCVM